MAFGDRFDAVRAALPGTVRRCVEGAVCLQPRHGAARSAHSQPSDHTRSAASDTRCGQEKRAALIRPCTPKHLLLPTHCGPEQPHVRRSNEAS